jgi:formylglycine-generating enzyme required for sulfatase activity
MFASSNVVRIWFDDSEWISINSGNFTYGAQDQLINIPYYYEIQKYPVTNVQYVKYLRENVENINILEDNGNWQVSGIFNYEGEGFSPGEVRDYFSFNNSQLTFDGLDFVVNTGFENHPITGVTWFGSYEYAEFENARLPNDQEWEKVSRSDLGYNYPWAINNDNDIINELRANFSGSNDPWDNLYKGTTPVGYYNGENGTLDSPSIYGAYDMAGNIREWTTTYNGSGFFFIKGGAFNMSISSVEHKSWEHEELEPNKSRYNLGLRCIRD